MLIKFDKNFKDKIYPKLKPEQQTIYINNVIPKLSRNQIDDFLFIYETFKFSGPPTSRSEAAQAKKIGKMFWQYLKKFPELKKLGFNDEDVNVSYFEASKPWKDF